MAGKRKRRRSGRGDRGDQGDSKRQRISGALNSRDPIVKQAVLAQYYPRVLSLRQYLLSKLPSASKIRKKKILSVGRSPRPDGKDETVFSNFLDQTLVGVIEQKEVSSEERIQQWTSFSQRADTSDFANLSGVSIFSQSEIVDFTIWLLFQKYRPGQGRVQHLLCQGFRKNVSARAVQQDRNATSTIPGLVSLHPNDHVVSMKAHPWTQVLALMGREGESTMIDLIIDCGIYISLRSGHGSYHQLSGLPLGELQPLSSEKAGLMNPSLLNPVVNTNRKTIRTPAEITFVRNRILYARANFSSQGHVRFGFRHIHVLNRHPHRSVSSVSENDAAKPNESTLHVMMYVFPRQFGLHNVFNSTVDSRQTIQPFQDYTLRETEIDTKYPTRSKIKIPKRLRITALRLIRKLQILHGRCSYKELLNHYCPVDVKPRYIPSATPPMHDDSLSTNFKTQNTCHTSLSIDSSILTTPVIIPHKPSMMDHSSPDAMVSAFCCATLSNLVPRKFWGIGEQQKHNEHVFYRNVDRFVRLRRFESLSLHEVCQGMKINSMDWLGLPSTTGHKLSQSDTNERWEVFHEFMYYVFDSLLIPLIRANFLVTESNIHRYRLFFFRHDVWRSLTEPAITSLKLTMFDEVKLEKAQRILDSRALGFSQVRLLPKETGMRPIMNLRRRMLKKGHKTMLGSSINSVLAPVYSMLSFEKKAHPSRLGASLFSVGDLYNNLKTFKSTLKNPALPLYFAKVDVKTAFDTIPQAAIVRLMACIPTHSTYRIAKHVEIKPGEGVPSGEPAAKPSRKWTALAHPRSKRRHFDELLETDLAIGRKNTVFVDNVVNTLRDTDELMALLAEHIQQNLVKIGKKFYRQKTGIPQGSVLSSLLCNYFYADLEATHLSFLQVGDSLLLRLIDDFLLITTKREHAKKFLEVMHGGLEEYGVSCNPDKTLVNFEVTVQERKVPRLVQTRHFPYCGNFIDTRNLNITKDRERRKDIAIGNSLTVEFSKIPGKAFHRKVLNTFKIQAHPMHLDTTHNSLPTVIGNISSAFHESALKAHAYIRLLPTNKRPRASLIIKTLKDLVELAWVLMQSKGKSANKSRMKDGKQKSMSEKEYRCAVPKKMVEIAALKSFEDVLGRRQTGYGVVLVWIRAKLAQLGNR